MANILVVAAHPDDEILGIGGTVRKCANNGDIIWCVILGEGMTSRNNAQEHNLEQLHKYTLQAANIVGYQNVVFRNLPDNRFDSINLLDITKVVEDCIDAFEPEIIYTHHSGDLNIDHRKTYEAVMTATRPFGENNVKKIYTFETPSSTEWQFGKQEAIFMPNTFIDIENTIEEKIKAMGCYTSEIREYPHPRSLEALKIIAKRWGTVVGKQFVEAFSLIRSIE